MVLKIVFYLFIFCFLFSCKKEDTKSIEIKVNKLAIYKAGEILYVNNCRACHGNTQANDHRLKNNITNLNYGNLYWIDYVSNQDSLIKSNDKFATQNVDDFQSLYRHNFDLTSQELKSILLYLKE